MDSAQVYRNEAAVGEAVKESDVPRQDIFLSEFEVFLENIGTGLMRPKATKCVSKTHGYESTLKGVDESLQKFASGNPVYSFLSSVRG